MNIESFSLPDMTADMEGLRVRIAATRWAPDISFDEQDRGIRPTRVRDLASYWSEQFEWQAFSDRLNDLPNFVAEIDNQTIHFLHIKSTQDGAIPLILLHGFPGSILEFLHVIEPLTDPDRGQAFNLVIPTHPGYGFSMPLSKPLGTKAIATLYARLMVELGYEKYLVQGGDMGAFIGPDMGRVAPDNVIGVHVNAASFGFIPLHELDDEEIAILTDAEKSRHQGLQEYNNDINWYFDVQAKRPQTIGYAMADSPVGLLGWLGNLFRDFSNHEHPLYDDDANRDIFFANLTLMWLTNSFASSINTYWEGMHDWSDYPTNSGVPTGVAVFAQDAAIRRYSEELNTIVHWSEYDVGGHFAALEAPRELVGDITAFARLCMDL